MSKTISILIFILICLVISGCYSRVQVEDSNGDSDGGVSDLDSDTDADTSTGADADGDSDVDLDCSETHPEWTMGLISCGGDVSGGYTLFAPVEYGDTFLIDLRGRLVHWWESEYGPGLAAYLLPNGHLLRTADIDSKHFLSGGAAGRVQEFDWDGNLVWEFEYASEKHQNHHDVKKMPNGNVLIIAWEAKTNEEAVAAGRNPEYLHDGLWPDTILEIEPQGTFGGSVVWEWHSWDHLIQDFNPDKANFGAVADYPGLIDINRRATDLTPMDWLHINSVDYNLEWDQILLSARNLSEIWIIDHSTTTAEAASHSGGVFGMGGDLIYRWGNPQIYGRGTAEDRRLFYQHDAHWIPEGLPGEGNILVFNNGLDRPGGDVSSADEIVPAVETDGHYPLEDEIFGPDEQLWTVSPVTEDEFFSRLISGAERLPNGNTLLCEGMMGEILEVAPDGEIVWHYINPVSPSGPMTQGHEIPESPKSGRNNWIFKALRYPPDFPGLAGKDLSPKGYIELPAD